MTRAIAADLERRGYIVYITVSSADEEHLVQSEHRADIKALWLDLTTVSLRSRAKLNNSLIKTDVFGPIRNPSIVA